MAQLAIQFFLFSLATAIQQLPNLIFLFFVLFLKLKYDAKHRVGYEYDTKFNDSKETMIDF